jgi:hypothetical protein
MTTTQDVHQHQIFQWGCGYAPALRVQAVNTVTEPMYGPVLIGAPCPKCGIDQTTHRGLTCESARWLQQEATHAALKPILEKLNLKGALKK